MRKLTYLATLMLAGTLTVSAADVAITVGGGTGTESDPYIISSPAHLLELAEACNTKGTTAAANSHFTGKFFKMTADIDMDTVTTFIGIGTAAYGKSSNQSAYYFDGTFDGAGHTIRNMRISAIAYNESGDTKTIVTQTGTGNPASRSSVGLFGNLWYNAVVKNVNLDASCSVSGYQYVGSIAGYLKADGTAAKPGHGSQVINCTSAATVTGAGSNVGGIAGYGSRTTANGMILIDGCAFTGKVTGDQGTVGGILGYGSRVMVTNSINAGYVGAEKIQYSTRTTSRTYAGGIMGNAQYPLIENCMNAGTIAGDYTIGGMVGNTARSNAEGYIRKSVNTGMIVCPDNTRKGIIAGKSNSGSGALVLEDVYYDSQLTAALGDVTGENEAAGEATGMLTRELTSGTAIASLPDSLWKFEAGFYPRLKQHDSDMARRAAATYFVLPDAVNTENFSGEATVSTAMAGITATFTDLPTFSFSGGKIIAANATELQDGTVTLTNGAYTMPIPVLQVPKFFQGSGTEADPYLIQNKQDLISLANSCLAPLMRHYEGEYFRLTQDIDLTGDTIFMGIATMTGVTDPSTTYYFAGNFDGQNHTIKGMKLNGIKFNASGAAQTYSNGSYNNLGFFGALDGNATVKNLHFDANCEVAGYQYVGTLAGRAKGQTVIENVTSAGKVTAYSGYAGGIVAWTDAVTAKDNPDTTAVKLNRVLFSGTVMSNGNNAGGITAYNKGVITESVNLGSVNAYKFNGNASQFKWVGGITGNNVGNIYDCANYGPVYSAGQVTSSTVAGSIGGIAGECGSTFYRGNIERCFNAGVVSSPTETAVYCGSIVGTRTNQQYVIKGVYDSQLSVYAGVANSDEEYTEGMATSALTAGNAIAPLGDKFTMTKGYYPMPTAWAADSRVKAAAATYFTLPAGQTISTFDTEGVIATTMALTARLAKTQGSIFSISGGKVIAGATQEIATDTLTLTNGAYSNVYPLMKVPKVLAGSGTQADPWQIATAADFNKIGAYMVAANTTFKGEYFKVLADIDFKDIELAPIGTQTILFEGIFDGNGKTFSNIKLEGDDDNQIHHIGLFSAAGENSEIFNLKLAASSFKGYGYVGGIAALANGKIHDIEISADCAITGTRKGTATSANQDGSYVGSIAAKMGQKAVIENVVNRAPVSTTQKYAGGIVGDGTDPASGTAPVAVIRNVVNYGDVISTAPRATVNSGGGAPSYQMCEAHIGGIAGFLRANIQNARNYGKVKGSQVNKLGGIAGSACLGSTIEKVENFDSIRGGQNVGGIVGFCVGSNSAKVFGYIKDALNHGMIQSGDSTAHGSSSTSFAGGNGTYTGGVAGNVSYGWNLYDCGNEGNIKIMIENQSYGHTAGGVIGFMASGTGKTYEVKRCYNTGDITAVNTIGGIIGLVQSGFAEVDSCFNTGNLTSICKNSSGEEVKPSMPMMSGIGSGALHMKNVYNAGNITGSVAAGLAYGVVGTTAENAFNMGSIIPTSATDTGDYIFAQGISNDRDGIEETNVYALSDGKQYAADTKYGVQKVDSLQLMNLAEKLGAAFVGHKAAFPMIAGLDTIAGAQFKAAWYQLAEGDTQDKITAPIAVANLKHVVWTSKDNFFTIADGVATPTGKGECSLTKTTGQMSRTYTFVSDFGEPTEITADGINYRLDPETLEAYVMAGEYTGVINIPATVTSYEKIYKIVGVDANAFKDATVTELTIGENVKTVGNDGFRNMRQLKSVATPSLAAWMGITFGNANANPLYNCHKLIVNGTEVGKTLTIPEGTEKIGGAYTFNGLSAEAVVIPATVKEIGNGVFRGMTSLKEIILPENCTTLGTGIFFGCSGLTKATLPAGIKEIPENTFYSCEALTDVNVPEGVETIGGMAFSGCSALTELTLPASLKTVGMMAFGDCSGMKKLIVKAETVPTAESMAFEGMDYNACTLYVPIGKVDAYKAAEEWKNFNTIEENYMGIAAIDADMIESVIYYTLDGRRLLNPARGQVAIAIYRLTDGTKVTRKVRF